MDKTLSQQICEICGIEERKKLVIGFDKLDITLPIFKTVKQTSNEPYIRVVKEHCLPDFENNNNNFVKLLEIVSKKASVSFCHNGTYYGCSIHYFFKDIFEAVEGTLQHSFLNTLLVQDLRNPCKPKLLEQIKQAIREVDWEY